MNDSRRLKCVSFCLRLLKAGHDVKLLFPQMLEQLPKDARLVRFGEDIATATFYMVFWSATFDEVPESQMVPELQMTFRDDYAPKISLRGALDLANRTPPPDCACDVAYIGGHRPSCPASRSGRGA
jgi:hypothetical protein